MRFIDAVTHLAAALIASGQYDRQGLDTKFIISKAADLANEIEAQCSDTYFEKKEI